MYVFPDVMVCLSTSWESSSSKSIVDAASFEAGQDVSSSERAETRRHFKLSALNLLEIELKWSSSEALDNRITRPLCEGNPRHPLLVDLTIDVRDELLSVFIGSYTEICLYWFLLCFLRTLRKASEPVKFGFTKVQNKLKAKGQPHFILVDVTLVLILVASFFLGVSGSLSLLDSGKFKCKLVDRTKHKFTAFRKST